MQPNSYPGIQERSEYAGGNQSAPTGDTNLYYLKFKFFSNNQELALKDIQAANLTLFIEQTQIKMSSKIEEKLEEVKQAVQNSLRFQECNCKYIVCVLTIALDETIQQLTFGEFVQNYIQNNHEPLQNKTPIIIQITCDLQ